MPRDIGSYSYAGTGYANPHAATTIGSKSLTYDNAGNTLTKDTFTYSWDFLNRLSQTATGTATTTYQYTPEGKRFLKQENGTTTYYTNDWYTFNADGTAEKRLMLEGELLATMKTKGGVSTTTYAHTDHLGSTEVVTDDDGDIVQTLDYLPYGKVRVDVSSSAANERKKFTGYKYDAVADLNYAQTRYYGQTEGRFLSQDIVFQNFGVDPRTKLVQEDPQLANAYSYARNNPLILKDETGEFVWVAPLIGAGIGAVGGLAGQVIQDVYQYQIAQRSDPSAKFHFSSAKEYAASAGGGALVGASASISILAGGGGAAGASLAQDWAGGNSLDPTKAILSGGATILSGGHLKVGVGQNALENVTRVTAEALKQGLRYTAAGEVLQTGINAVGQQKLEANRTVIYNRGDKN